MNELTNHDCESCEHLGKHSISYHTKVSRCNKFNKLNPQYDNNTEYPCVGYQVKSLVSKLLTSSNFWLILIGVIFAILLGLLLQ